MKKYLLFTLFIVYSSFSATTGTLVVTGILPQILSLVITPTTGSTLDLSINQTSIKIADVAEYSNSSTGFKILLSSANSGKLKRVGGTELITYTATYNGSSAVLSNTNQVVKTIATPGVHSVSSEVRVSHSAASNIAGTYTDTLTLTIQAN